MNKVNRYIKRTILFNCENRDRFTVKPTLISMSPILFTALIIGLPTMDGKIWAGKLEPAYPHLTNCNK